MYNKTCKGILGIVPRDYNKNNVELWIGLPPIFFDATFLEIEKGAAVLRY
ncbi:MAG: hypothetical protein KBS56_06515 [Clostridiales bacterium]|nr:hypothetical protein [Candidatus Crickella equi]